MRIDDVQLNERYWAKVSGRMTIVKVTGFRCDFNSRVLIEVLNETTGRRLTFRSAGRLRCPAAETTSPPQL